MTCSCEEVDETLNALSLEIAKECMRGRRYRNAVRMTGSVVTAEVVEKVLKKSNENEMECKEDRIAVYDAFDSPLVHFDRTSRQYYLFDLVVRIDV